MGQHLGWDIVPWDQYLGQSIVPWDLGQRSALIGNHCRRYPDLVVVRIAVELGLSKRSFGMYRIFIIYNNPALMPF
jgi:hypothetical protein